LDKALKVLANAASYGIYAEMNRQETEKRVKVETVGDYISDVFRASKSELDTAVAQHIYELAGICNRKQRRVRLATLAGLAGFIAGFLWLAALRVVAAPEIRWFPDIWQH
jgi:hypothetical protein